jgi:primosomal protein N' (replication factor Y)
LKVASVLIPLPVPEAFDYEVAADMDVERGDQVAVPLGPRLMRGIVSEVRETTGSNRRLKAVEMVLDDPRLPPGTVDFVEWAARWTLNAPGEMAATALKGLRAPKPRPERRVRRVEGREPARPTASRTAVLEALGTRSIPGPDLARAAAVSSGVVKGLIDEGVLEVVEIEAVAAFDAPDPDHAPASLNADQATSAAAIADAVQAGGFAPFLLDGVTGSGKTEAYLEAAARALRADPTAQILILLPEIALTQALIARLTDRFGAARRNGIRASPRRAGGRSGRRWSRGAATSWSGPVRPCSCPSPI